MALMALSDSEVKTCSKSCLKNYEALKKQYDDLLVKLNDTGFKAATYKRGLTTLEGQIVKYKEHEVLSLSLEEFKRTELMSIGPRNSSFKPTTRLNEKFFYPANPCEAVVEDDEEQDESKTKPEKKTVIPTAAKIEKPVWKPVKYAEMYSAHKHMAPKAVLMKTGLKSFNTARPDNTVVSVNTDLLTKGFDAGRFQYLISRETMKCEIGYSMMHYLRGGILFALEVTAEASTDTDGEVTITAIIDGQSKTITEASLKRHLKLEDHDGITSILNSEIFEQLALMGYQINSDKLTFQNGVFSPQWRFLIHTLLHCLSPKKTAWEQFSSNIATALICLATNRKYNFFRLIF
ncbi:hypothetical protein Tco_1134685 [Tanacetum coccineum]